MRVVCGNGDLSLDDPAPSTDEAYIGRIGRNIDDGSLSKFGSMREQWLQFADGETKWFYGWQLEHVHPELDLEQLRLGHGLSVPAFATLVQAWLDRAQGQDHDSD